MSNAWNMKPLFFSFSFFPFFFGYFSSQSFGPLNLIFINLGHSFMYVHIVLELSTSSNIVLQLLIFLLQSFKFWKVQYSPNVLISSILVPQTLQMQNLASKTYKVVQLTLQWIKSSPPVSQHQCKSILLPWLNFKSFYFCSIPLQVKFFPP